MRSGLETIPGPAVSTAGEQSCQAMTDHGETASAAPRRSAPPATTARSGQEAEKPPLETDSAFSGERPEATQSQRLAEVGRVVASVAHESRNSLQRIQGAADLLELEVADSADALRLVSVVKRGVEEIRTLLEEVREYAAPVRLSRSRQSLQAIWRQAWANVADVHQSKQPQLIEQLLIPSDECDFDAFRIGQVFRNLFENALATVDDRPVVTVGCVNQRRQDQDWLEVTVGDNGPGFSPQTAETAFLPFFSTKTSGTGLGLSICERIVVAHGGAIAIGRRPDGGAALTFSLPVGDGDLPA